MPIVVRVVSQEDYGKWVGEQKKMLLAQQDDPNKKWDTPDLLARGEKVYGANCVACHQPTGRGMPPAFPPLVGSKLVTGAKEGHIDIVLNGKSGTAMAPFGKQLSDTEIAAVISYERSTWGNKSGIVQPAEVKARRK
jgi:cytochrome c oxidase subunit 2